MDEKTLPEFSAAVYNKNDNGVYYVKLLFNNWGMYISGITVRDSIKYTEKWIQMPSFRAGNQYKRYIEFAENSTLQEAIREKVLQAIEDYDSDASNYASVDLSQVPDFGA